IDVRFDDFPDAVRFDVLPRILHGVRIGIERRDKRRAELRRRDRKYSRTRADVGYREAAYVAILKQRDAQPRGLMVTGPETAGRLDEDDDLAGLRCLGHVPR